MSGTAIKVPTEFKAVDKFTSVVKKMTTGVSRFAKSGVSAVQRFDTKINKTLNNMGKISKLAIGLGIGTLFTAAIQNNIAYNDSLASVSAITGAVGEDLVLLEKLSMKTAKAQKMLGSDVLNAYELVGSAKPELLENTKLLDKVTNSAITLSKAGRMDLAPAAEALTTTLNQFGLGGEYAGKVIDNLAAGAKFGSSSITNTSTALSKFGTIAAATGTKVNESIALIELVSPFEKGAEAGTKLRNVLGKMAGAKILPAAALKTLKSAGVDIDVVTNASLPLSQRLKEMAKVGANATDVMQVFGSENAALAQAIFDNVGGFDKMLEKIDSTGVANEQAATNTNTLRFGIEAIKNSFLNATTATNSNNTVLDMLKKILFGVANNMETVVSVLGGAIIAYGIMKAVLWGSKAAMFAYNVVLGINTALTGNNKRAIIGNTIATNAYKVAMAIGTAITWLANSAFVTLAVSILAATWPILAVIAAITAIIYIFLYWDEIVAWFKDKLVGFVKFLISVPGKIASAWGDLVLWFKEFDFVDFFKQIGQSIINFMLMPLKTMLWLVSKMPGKLGVIGKDALAKVNDITGNILVDKGVEDKLDSPSSETLLDSPETNAANIAKDGTGMSKAEMQIKIMDKGNNVENVSTKSTDFPVNVTPTLGAF